MIELDGSQHFTKEGLAYDAIRTEIIEYHHFKVLRFTNGDLKTKFEAVCALIDHTVKARLAEINE